MKCDVILAGVGGQGVLSVASIIALAAMEEGFQVRQSEVHGMAQRGGAVSAHLRMADGTDGGGIAGDLAPQGGVDLIISMEPLESLRYLSWLKKSGTLVTSSDPLVNIGNYPDLKEITSVIKRLPRWRLVAAGALAKEAGLLKAVNTVMVGAASPFLPVAAQALEKTITAVFSKKESSALKANVKAFKLGQIAAQQN